jgi:hypothetical protein
MRSEDCGGACDDGDGEDTEEEDDFNRLRPMI